MRDYTLINGDLLDADADYICHQVNCQGKMKSGVAKAIREKWSCVYDAYYTEYLKHKYNSELLGLIQSVNLNNTKNPHYCINMFAQNNYGYDGKQYTSLEAFRECLEKINKMCKDKVVAFPWLIGCVRGGADWNVVLPMICEVLTDVKEIKFYKL